MPENDTRLTAGVHVRFTGRMVFGLLVIALGVIFTLDSLGIVEAGPILRWWPVVPLAFGLARLVGAGGRRDVGSGLFLTVVFGWILLHNLHFVRYDVWDFWPVIFIVAGAAILTGGFRRRREAVGGQNGAPQIDAFAFMSGTDRKVVAPDFRGGYVTAIMGGHQIDLRGAQTSAGPATLELFVLWGGIDIRVPEDWKVSNEAQVIMGGVEDSSRIPPGEPRGHLILKGFVMMGGVDVKN